MTDKPSADLESILRYTPPNAFKSAGEQRIADFLDRHGIKYIYEPPTAVTQHGKTRLWYPDFLLTEYGLYIEYYGRVGDPDYDLGTSLAYWAEAEDPGNLRRFDPGAEAIAHIHQAIHVIPVGDKRGAQRRVLAGQRRHFACQLDLHGPANDCAQVVQRRGLKRQGGQKVLRQIEVLSKKPNFVLSRIEDVDPAVFFNLSDLFETIVDRLIHGDLRQRFARTLDCGQEGSY